jgi:hypothetical protein
VLLVAATFRGAGAGSAITDFAFFAFGSSSDSSEALRFLGGLGGGVAAEAFLLLAAAVY